MPQAGLIQNAQSTSYDPEKLVLDPTTQTVQGRVQDIMKSDSPFVAQARTSAAQAQNQKGTLNSSMAIGEGEKAAYNAALPIASADANAALNVAQANTAATNTARQAGATAENQMGLQTLQGKQQLGYTDSNGNFVKGSIQLQGDSAKELANIEAGYKTTMQSNDSAARFYSQISSSIADILKEPNISVEGKRDLVMQQTGLLKTGLAVMGGIASIDLSKYVDFTDYDAWLAAKKPAQESANAVTAANVAAGSPKTYEDANAAYLKANPDVAASSVYGSSPYQHYLDWGKGEGRKWIGPTPP